MSEDDVQTHEHGSSASEMGSGQQDSSQGHEATQASEKTVPLAAYEAERRKRQEIEQQNRVYQEYLLKQAQQQSAEKQEESDPNAWVETKQLAEMEQKIRESVYVESNPERLHEIDLYLETIVKQKPWLRQAIASSNNRYATAWEIVQDYKHLVTGKQEKAKEAQRIVENARKPGSPLTVGKTVNSSNGDYLMSLRGTPEFKKYRQQMLKGK